MQHSAVPVTLQLPGLPVSSPCVYVCPDVSWAFEGAAKSGGGRTAEIKRGPIAQWTWNSPANNGCTAVSFFFFFGTNKWINWRSPSKASICISLGIINPANADWAHKEVRKETCTFGICVQTKERLGERREWQAKGVKRALWLIIQKQSSSWAEADVRRAHHRAASAPVAVPTTPPPSPFAASLKAGPGFAATTLVAVSWVWAGLVIRRRQRQLEKLFDRSLAPRLRHLSSRAAFQADRSGRENWSRTIIIKLANQ